MARKKKNAEETPVETPAETTATTATETPPETASHTLIVGEMYTLKGFIDPETFQTIDVPAEYRGTDLSFDHSGKMALVIVRREDCQPCELSVFVENLVPLHTEKPLNADDSKSLGGSGIPLESKEGTHQAIESDLAGKVAETAEDFVDLELLHEAYAAHDQATAAKTNYELAHAKAKELKLAWENKVEEAHKLFEQARNRQEPNLFSNSKAPAKPTEPKPEPVAETKPEPVDLSWREVRLDSLEGFTPKLLENLLSANIATVGQLADFTSVNPTNPGHENRLTDIKGIGAAAATKIDAALEKFWAARNAVRPVELPPVEDAEETETPDEEPEIDGGEGV